MVYRKYKIIIYDTINNVRNNMVEFNISTEYDLVGVSFLNYKYIQFMYNTENKLTGIKFWKNSNLIKDLWI